jgi:hypothetical protein
MGYDSITGIFAKKIEVENRGYTKDIFALFIQVADSNWYVERNNRQVMDRAWHLMKLGEKWQVMRSVVKYSIACEGGSLKMKGKDVGADSLIRASRKELNRAVSVDNLADSGSRYGWGREPSTSNISFYMKNSDIEKRSKDSNYEKELLDELLKGSISKDEEGVEFSFKADKEGISEYLKYSDLHQSIVHYCRCSSEPWELNRRGV